MELDNLVDLGPGGNRSGIAGLGIKHRQLASVRRSDCQARAAIARFEKNHIRRPTARTKQRERDAEIVARTLRHDLGQADLEDVVRTVSAHVDCRPRRVEEDLQRFDGLLAVGHERDGDFCAIGLIEVEQGYVVCCRHYREVARHAEKRPARRRVIHASRCAAQAADGTTVELLAGKRHHRQVIGVVEHGTACSRGRGRIVENGKGTVVGLGQLVVAARQVVACRRITRRWID